MQVPDTFEWL